jgi:hypothetical protein
MENKRISYPAPEKVWEKTGKSENGLDLWSSRPWYAGEKLQYETEVLYRHAK